MHRDIVNHSPDSPALAGEGWGGGASTKILPEWRDLPPPAALSRVDLPRKRER